MGVARCKWGRSEVRLLIGGSAAGATPSWARSVKRNDGAGRGLGRTRQGGSTRTLTGDRRGKATFPAAKSPSRRPTGKVALQGARGRGEAPVVGLQASVIRGAPRPVRAAVHGARPRRPAATEDGARRAGGRRAGGALAAVVRPCVWGQQQVRGPPLGAQRRGRRACANSPPPASATTGRGGRAAADAPPGALLRAPRPAAAAAHTVQPVNRVCTQRAGDGRARHIWAGYSA